MTVGARRGAKAVATHPIDTRLAICNPPSRLRPGWSSTNVRPPTHGPPNFDPPRSRHRVAMARISTGKAIRARKLRNLVAASKYTAVISQAKRSGCPDRAIRRRKASVGVPVLADGSAYADSRAGCTAAREPHVRKPREGEQHARVNGVRTGGRPMRPIRAGGVKVSDMRMNGMRMRDVRTSNLRASDMRMTDRPPTRIVGAHSPGIDPWPP
jgi:hypothetical protein